MRTGSLRVFRIAGIDVYVHVSWLVVFALVTWSLAVGYYPPLLPDLSAAQAWTLGAVSAILLFASVLYSLPFAVQPFSTAIASVDPRLVEASHALGASPLRTFFRVTLPLAWHGVVAGAVLAFAHTLGEFGVVLMVGGNVAGETRTLSISLFDQVEALDYGAASQTAALLLALSFAVLTLVYALQRRPGSPWTAR